MGRDFWVEYHNIGNRNEVRHMMVMVFNGAFRDATLRAEENRHLSRGACQTFEMIAIIGYICVLAISREVRT
jgi:hypothetical protein